MFWQLSSLLNLQYFLRVMHWLGSVFLFCSRADIGTLPMSILSVSFCQFMYRLLYLILVSKHNL